MELCSRALFKCINCFLHFNTNSQHTLDVDQLYFFRKAPIKKDNFDIRLINLSIKVDSQEWKTRIEFNQAIGEKVSKYFATTRPL